MAFTECVNKLAPSRVHEKFARCRKCAPCLLQRSLEWRNRLAGEAAFNEAWPQLLTLSYAPGNLPETAEECTEQWQLFAKRWRKAGYDLRYFAVVEKGSKNGRLHNHAILWSKKLSKLTIQDKYAFVDRIWKLGRTQCHSVRGPGGLKYVSDYLSPGANDKKEPPLWYGYSRVPILGRVFYLAWRKAVTEMHIQKPFDEVNRMPAFLNLLVLGRLRKVYVTERQYCETAQDLGVQRAVPDRLARVLYSGVPNGPVNLKKIHQSVEHGAATIHGEAEDIGDCLENGVRLVEYSRHG